MQTFLEWLTLIGAISGLGVTFFTIWDRWARWRPVAHLTPSESVAGSLDLRVINVAPIDIIILDIDCHPRRFAVARGHEMADIVDAHVSNPLCAVLRAHDEAIYPVAKVGDWPDDATGRVRFSISWRKTSFTWLPQAPVSVRASTADIRNLRGQ